MIASIAAGVTAHFLFYQINSFNEVVIFFSVCLLFCDLKFFKARRDYQMIIETVLCLAVVEVAILAAWPMTESLVVGSLKRYPNLQDKQLMNHTVKELASLLGLEVEQLAINIAAYSVFILAMAVSALVKRNRADENSENEEPSCCYQIQLPNCPKIQAPPCPSRTQIPSCPCPQRMQTSTCQKKIEPSSCIRQIFMNRCPPSEQSSKPSYISSIFAEGNMIPIVFAMFFHFLLGLDDGLNMGKMFIMFSVTFCLQKAKLISSPGKSIVPDWCLEIFFCILHIEFWVFFWGVLTKIVTFFALNALPQGQGDVYKLAVLVTLNGIAGALCYYSTSCCVTLTPCGVSTQIFLRIADFVGWVHLNIMAVVTMWCETVCGNSKPSKAPAKVKKPRKQTTNTSRSRSPRMKPSQRCPE